MLKTDKIQLIVAVDTKDGIREIGYLQAEYQRLSEAQKRTKSWTEDKSLGESMGMLKEKIAEARKEYGLTALTMKELLQYQRELANQKSNQFTFGTDQYKEAEIEYQKVSQRIKDVRTNSERVEAEQVALRAELQKTIAEFGTEALSIQQLKTLQGLMFTEMTRGAKSGTVANSEHAASYRQVVAALSKAESEVSKSTIIEKTNTAAIHAAVKANGLKSLSLIDMKAYHASLTKQIEESAEHEGKLNQDRIKEAQDVANVIDQRQQNIKGTESIFSSFKSQLPAALIGGAAGGIAAMATDKVGEVINGILTKFKEGIESIKKTTRDVTDIETTLNISLFDATKINSQLSKINTERPRGELKELVLVAGGLDVATKDVIKFTESADKVEKVFGNDFGGVGQASEQIFKLKESFKETKDLGVEESFSKIGSSIKTLNLAGPATTKGVVDFISRIGQIPDAFKPSFQSAAALGAIFEEANLTAEISSGGIQNVLLTASQNGKEFGKVFGQSKKEFLEFLTTNPVEFLTKLSEKVKGLDDAQLGEFLKSIKINSAESVKTIGVLSDNLDKFYAKEKVNAEAFAKGTKIDEIFSVFNNDGAAEITKAEKKLETFYTKITGFVGIFGKAALVSFSQLLPDTQTELEKTTKKFEDQKKVVNALDTDIANHIKTINEYKKSGDKSGISQSQLKTAIDSVAKAIPSAITQFDSLGNAMDINTAAAERNIKKQRDLFREIRQNTIEINKAELASLTKKADKVQYDLNKGTYFENNGDGFVTERRLTDSEITKKQEELATLQGDIKAVKSGLNEVEFGLDSIANRRANRRAGNPLFERKEGTGTFDSGEDKGKEGKDKAEKAAEQYRKEIDMLAEITYKRDQALADEENKKVLAAERQSQTQELSIKKEIQNEARRKIALEQNEKELVDSVTAIRAEYQAKREKQVEDQTVKSIEIAQKAVLTEKQLAVEIAEAGKDDFAIYNAKFDLNQHLRNQDLASLEAKHTKEQQSLKGNAEAIRIAEENYDAEVLAIKAKYIAEDDKLLLNLVKNTKSAADKTLEIKRKALLEEKALDVKQAEITAGGDVLGAKLSLLEEEMRQELSIKDLTEIEKTNIVRKYNLERSTLEQDSFRAIASQAVELFGQAFSTIASFSTDRIKREETEESEKFTKVSEMLKQQNESGVLSDAEYKKAKTASEKAHDKEVRKLKYEQAKNDKVSNIAQATINGVQAVMKGYAQTGPLGGTALAVIMGAISAIQIGKIAATRLPSYYYGGAMPSRVSQPLDSLGGFPIMAHPDEFMVSAHTRATPFFAAIEPILESVNKGGRMPEFTSTNAAPVSNNQAVAKDSGKLLQVLDSLNETQKVLVDRLDNLEVRLGGHDYEKIGEGLLDVEKQNKKAII